jgi:hypothetical protein
MEILVARIARPSASIAFGLAALLSAFALPAAASVAEDAKKICLERYNVEKAGGTIPAGMPKSKYMKQCTSSIARNAALQEKLADDAAAQGAGGQGGPTVTDPSKIPGVIRTPTQSQKPAAPSGH